MAIRLKVREIALEKEMSQRRLSRLTGIDIKNIQRVFRNDRAIVNTETLDRLATALEVEPGDLIEHVED
jgi:DNA-binding Xre family transcriptional regulator